jgi:hypothetical protein
MTNLRWGATDAESASLADSIGYLVAQTLPIVHEMP